MVDLILLFMVLVFIPGIILYSDLWLMKLEKELEQNGFDMEEYRREIAPTEDLNAITQMVLMFFIIMVIIIF